VDRVKNSSRSPEERWLLDAIFAVAADIQEADEECAKPAFSEDFIGAFTKKQANLVLQYIAATPPSAVSSDNTIIRNPLASPATIIKAQTSAPPPEDDA
jgi:hypothetical protein